MNILITGSSGFVGKNLRRSLNKEKIVTPCRQELLSLNSSQLDFFDIIIHLAGKAHDIKNISNPDEYYKVNYELTKNLYDAFLQSKASKFIFISSVKAVTDAVETILTEDEIPDPQTDYGKSKLLAEQYILAHSVPLGKSFYILRPCMIHGPGNKGNLNLLYKLVQKGIPYPLGAYQNKRSFLTIDNLCFVINELIQKDIPAGIYNVADDDSLATVDVIKLIGESSEKKIKILKLPPKLINGLAKIGTLLHLPFNSHRLKKLTDNYVVSNSKIKSVLNKNLPINSRQGLINTFKSFNSHGG